MNTHRTNPSPLSLLLVLLLALLALLLAACQVADSPGDSAAVSDRPISERPIVVRGADLPLPYGLGEFTAEEVRLPHGASPLTARDLRVELDPRGISSLLTSHGASQPSPSDQPRDLSTLARGAIDGLTVTLAGRSEEWFFHSLQWTLSPRLSPTPGLDFEARLFDHPYDYWGLNASITLTATGIEVRDGELRRGRHTLGFQASIARGESDRRVDVSLDPVACETLLSLVPDSWKAPFAELKVEGTVAPWIEVSDRHGVRDFRLGGFATEDRRCEVATLAWSPPPGTSPGSSRQLREADVTWLNGSFLLPVVEGLPAGVAVDVGPGRADYVALDDLPAHVEAAFYLSEEPDFFHNAAFSPSLLSHAMTRNLQELRLVAGGSTVTQQLTKNLFLTRERTFSRKFQEALLATRISQVVSRERILELYINCIKLGPGVYGVEAAAWHYFRTSAADLTPSEAAFLAAITPWPSHGEEARRAGSLAAVPGLDTAARAILAAMERQGYIIDQDLTLTFQGAS